MDPYVKALVEILAEITDRYENVLYSEFSRDDDGDKIIARAKTLIKMAKGGESGT